MKVTVTYHDEESLTIEEVVRQAQLNYGKLTEVEVVPESSAIHEYIYFSIQQMITHEQMSLLFERDIDYGTSIAKLRRETLATLAKAVDRVIIDNEEKAS